MNYLIFNTLGKQVHCTPFYLCNKVCTAHCCHYYCSCHVHVVHRSVSTVSFVSLLLPWDLYCSDVYFLSEAGEAAHSHSFTGLDRAIFLNMLVEQKDCWILYLYNTLVLLRIAFWVYINGNVKFFSSRCKEIIKKMNFGSSVCFCCCCAFCLKTLHVLRMSAASTALILKNKLKSSLMIFSRPLHCIYSWHWIGCHGDGFLFIRYPRKKLNFIIEQRHI